MPKPKDKSFFLAVNDLLQYREMLPESLEASLHELGREVSARLCPYPAEQLEMEREKLNQKFPDYEHWYIRWGETVTWCDRRKQVGEGNTDRDDERDGLQNPLFGQVL
jgi:hypothetical protein